MCEDDQTSKQAATKHDLELPSTTRLFFNALVGEETDACKVTTHMRKV